MLSIERQDRGEVTILKLEGELDALNAPSLKRETEALVVEERFKVIFDLAALQLIDSSGVGSMVSLLKRVVPRQGNIRIACLSGQPREMFKLLRLDQAFDLTPDVQTAVERFGS